MSKGGAGKVYFVLYLAVILELLIIFIERDEAEENLRKQQQQAIEIVQTILSQLQTGAGATGMTTRPKDNIVLSIKEPETNVRTYDVIVSVGDPKATLKSGLRGDDIGKLDYILSHNGNPEIEEIELGPDSADIVGGNVIFKASLGMDVGGYEIPKQESGYSIPSGVTDRYFTLNEEATASMVAEGKSVKVFTVNFKPNQGEGWYRLRFHSETNKIVGVTGGAPQDMDTVRIGTVRLTVKQLKQVQKALIKRRKSDDPKSKVEEYIETLLTPNAYKTLDENQSYTSINVRVTEPDIPDPADPFAEILVPGDTIYWYNIAPFQVPVKLGPIEGTRSVQGTGARLVAVDEQRSQYRIVIDNPSASTPLIAKAENAGKPEVSEKYLVVAEPALRGGIKRWRGLRATVGKKYNPTSEWESTVIPDGHYQTVVIINGKEVFNKSGITFKDSDLPDELLVTEQSKDIDTKVYWKPGGTPTQQEWKPLLSSNSGTGAFIEGTGVSPQYQAPIQFEGFEFDWLLNGKSLKKEFGPITIKQAISPTQSIGVRASATCSDCAEYGIVGVRLVPGGDDTQWQIYMEADPSKLKPAVNGKRFEIPIEMSGRGGADGVGVVYITVKVVR